VEYVLRFWICEKCSRANKTAVAPDGTVTCEQCANVMSVGSLKRRKPLRPDDRVGRLLPRA
jgi:hypothetical protein